ncbi:uncharacterized protein LOC135134345 [Zophobas morio]|uniref:uncharacterized protein LOC135134345 n=1 Tax=Zophobas morio TaxID=2755281 RepID=UPI0030834589
MNKCALHFCVGFMAFILITTGMIRVFQVITAGDEVGGSFVWFYFIMGFVHLVSGLLLAYGAAKEKPKLVFAHLVITISCLGLATIGVLFIICFMNLSNGTGIVVGYVAAICIFFGLERAVYEFYKELKSEPQEVDAHTTSEV